MSPKLLDSETAAELPVGEYAFRVTFDPAEVLNMISNEYFQATLNGAALIDQSKDNDPTLGNFGRIVLNLT